MFIYILYWQMISSFWAVKAKINRPTKMAMKTILLKQKLYYNITIIFKYINFDFYSGT